MNKSVYNRWMDHLNFLSTMATDRKMDWNYYLFDLMLIDAFCEMQSNFYCDKGRVASQIVVSLIQGYHSADSFHAINLLTSALFTVNTMWTN